MNPAKSNIANPDGSCRTIFCHDNLEVLRGINSACIDLIYLDPPFNKKKTFTAPIGSSAEGAEFSDIFKEKDVKEDWLKDIKEDHYPIHELLSAVKNIEGRKSYNFCYLAYMAIRLMECHRVLKDTGSLYLHCDPTMSHYLKLMLDCIFGEKNFKNELIWKRTFAHNDPKKFGRNRDAILFYVKTQAYFFNSVLVAYDQSYIDNFFRYEDKRGPYRLVTLTGPKVNPNDEEYKGYSPADSGRSWSIPQRIIAKLTNKQDLSTLEKLDLMEKNDYIVFSQNGVPSFKSYLEDLEGAAVQEVWTDIPPVSAHAKERTGYPTQKPMALLERIIKASSKQGDIVLDPFCGCATTCVASEKLKRKWIGIDVSVKAYELVKERLGKEIEGSGTLFYEKLVDFKTGSPARTDQGVDYLPAKYVYIISNPQYEGEYKVGIASNVKNRLNSYQTADPERKYKLEYAHLTPYFREIEAYIHEKYRNKHEWVKGNLEDIKKDIEHHSSKPTELQ